MMSYKLRFSQYNERSILVEWPEVIDENTLRDVLNYKNNIENKNIEDIVEVIAAYNSIIIIYVFTIDNINDAFLHLKSIYKNQNRPTILNSKIYKIPVCYEDEFAMDLECFCEEKRLSKDEVVRMHSQTFYTVYFIGFLPGFLYLGGLNSALHLERKTTPNLNIKKGSVAIGGKQTGIYPQDSPGGWHIIGNSPVQLFDPKRSPPCFIKAGDKVKFHPISKHEYERIQKDVNTSNFNSDMLFHND